MKRFIEGQNRTQSTMFPATLDEYIDEENPVRFVDAYIEGLNLNDIGFELLPKQTGRPGYHPSVMLKIYIYGYLNRIQSSRRLETETNRNIELMWLTNRLSPDFKTIADFRKDNGKAIQQVCKEFVLLCGQIGLLKNGIVAIDGSKFKAVNTRDKSFSERKIKLRIEEVEKSIKRYFKDLDAADITDPEGLSPKTVRMKDKLERLELQLKGLKENKKKLEASPTKTISLTDPDSRLMKGGQGITVGYNVQTAVDSKSHLIVAHEVTTDPSDRKQLSNMATQAQEVMETENLTVLADRGYYKGTEILACKEAGIETFVPKTNTSNKKAKGQFSKEDFKYNVKENVYICPADEKLIYRMTTTERGMNLHRYWSSACHQCEIKSQCTDAKDSRRITRWEHEEVLEELAKRVENNPDAMILRKQTVEHPFGTLKMWMGSTHFQMKRLKNVKTEMSLHVLAYNIKRVINIVGMEGLMATLEA